MKLIKNKSFSITNKIAIGLLLFTSTTLPVLSQAGVLCELQNFKACKDCGQRIPASCEDHAYNGSVSLSTKPIKLHWKINNTKSGLEQVEIQDVKNLTLKEIKAAKNLKTIAGSIGKKLDKNSTLELMAVEIPSETALYTDQKSTVISAQMQNKKAMRMIASVNDSPKVGGIARAQKMNSHNTESKNTNSKNNKKENKGETK